MVVILTGSNIFLPNSSFIILFPPCLLRSFIFPSCPRVFLMGQSAGAHIAACALLDQAVKESCGERISWSVSQIKAYFGLSGG